MRSVAVILFCLGWVSVAAGADVWLELDPPDPETDETIHVRMFEGPRFDGREVSFDPGRITLLQRLWRNGRRNLTGRKDHKPLSSFAVEHPGVQLVVCSAASPGGAIPDTFLKAILVVGTSERRDPLRWSEVGQRLELVPQSDPVSLAERGGALEVQLLFEREPLADVVVLAVPQGDPEAAIEARTDEIGLVRFDLKRKGRWLVLARHRGRCSDCGTSERLEFRASLMLTSGETGR